MNVLTELWKDLRTMTRATYETTDLKDELRFRVVREYGLARKILSGPVLAVLGAFFLGYYYYAAAGSR